MHKHLFRMAAVSVLLSAVMAIAAQAQTISTVAGGGPDNLPATSSSIGAPWAVVQDSHGNTYISDNLSNRVFKVTSTGTLTVFAGNIVSRCGLFEVCGGGESATAVSLNSPRGLALDANGNVYIADAGNNVIRVVNTQSTSITVAGVSVPVGDMGTIAGNGTSCASPSGTPPTCGDTGPATSANLTGPSGLWLDGSGNIYIADTGDNEIRLVTASTGVITTVAGNGGAGYTGDGAAATAEELNGPQDVYISSSGALIIADSTNYRIRAVNVNSSGSITVLGVPVAAGKIETVAGNGSQCTTGPTLCGDGSSALGAEITSVSGIVEDGSGNLYIADSGNNVVREVTNTSPFDISLFAGSSAGTSCTGQLTNICGDGGTATSAELWEPTGVFVSGSDVLIADQNDDVTRQVSAGTISRTAGVYFNTAFSGDNSAATSASLRSPVGVYADEGGDLYVADTLNDAIRKVTATTGDIATIAGIGNVSCLSSQGLGLPCGDGTAATAANLSFPTDVFIDSHGNIFIADYEPSAVSVIREVSASTGDINTVAGSFSLGPGYSGDGHAANAAQISGDSPSTCSTCTSRLSVFVDSAGVLYIADTGNSVIRAVNTNASGSVKVAGVTIAAGNIATIAGVQTTPCATSTSACGDTGPATSASLNAPGGVAVDSTGNIYISDSNDNRVRVVDSAGMINKFAGTGTACTTSCGDGGPATSANLDQPQHLLLDFQGNVYIADSEDFEIREVTVSDGTITGVVDANQIPGFGGDGGPSTSEAALLSAPYGLAADDSGNLYISDVQQWRIRKVTKQVITPPTAALSLTSLSFPSEGTGVASPAQSVTVTNNGFGSPLSISKVAIAGTDPGDFAIAANTCGVSLAAGSNCSISVTFAPTATGSRAATLTLTDNATSGTQNVSLSGTGLAQSFTIPTPNPSTKSVSAGSSATYSISISAANGFAGSVALSCTKGLPTGATCSFSPTSIKPGTTSTLTIATTAPTSSALTAPAIRQQSVPMFAMWLLMPAMLLSTAGMSAGQRKKLISYLLLTLAIAGVLFLVACGGGGSSSTTTPPTGGTPSGTYTVTVQGTSGSLNATTNVTLTVQ